MGGGAHGALIVVPLAGQGLTNYVQGRHDKHKLELGKPKYNTQQEGCRFESPGMH